MLRESHFSLYTIHLYWYSASPSSLPTGSLVFYTVTLTQIAHLYWYIELVLKENISLLACIDIAWCPAEERPFIAYEASADKISCHLNKLPICFMQTLCSLYRETWKEPQQPLPIICLYWYSTYPLSLPTGSFVLLDTSSYGTQPSSQNLIACIDEYAFFSFPQEIYSNNFIIVASTTLNGKNFSTQTVC